MAIKKYSPCTTCTFLGLGYIILGLIIMGMGFSGLYAQENEIAVSTYGDNGSRYILIKDQWDHLNKEILDVRSNSINITSYSIISNVETGAFRARINIEGISSTGTLKIVAIDNDNDILFEKVYEVQAASP